MRIRHLIVSCVIAFAWSNNLRADGRKEARKPIHVADRILDTTRARNIKSDKSVRLDTNQPYIIQLSGPITKEMQTALDASGIRLGDYLPTNAYVVSLSNNSAARLRELPFVEWVGDYDAAWKLDATIAKRNYATPERRATAGRGDAHVLITLFSGRPARETLAELGKMPGTVVLYVEHVGGCETISATVRAADVHRLAKLPDVQWVGDAPEITPRNSTTRWIIQSNIPNVTPIYDHGITGVGQIIGITDLRVDSNHCSFFDAVNPIGPLHRKILAYNTTIGLSTHGTHVAGIAAGDNNINDDTRGIAYGAKFVYSYYPTFTEMGVYSTFQLHHNQGARTHCNSWGNEGTRNYEDLCRGIDSFVYDYEDSLVCFAVSNGPICTNPENAKNLLAVAAVQDDPGQNLFCKGGTGPTLDGRRKPEIMTVGCNVYSALTGSGCNVTPLMGTSMACPAVTAAGALMRQYFMDGFYPTGIATPANAYTPSAALLKAALLNTSVDATGIAGYPSFQEGWGRILLDSVCFFPGDARRMHVPADIRNATGLSTGQEQSYIFRVIPSAEQLRATLVWTDPPASAATGGGPAAINDLDLEVTTPSAVTYLGNVFSGGVSVTGGVKDDKNNVEQVHLNSPEAGLWTVKVKAPAVNVGTQGYAIVLTGAVFPSWAAPTASAILPSSGDSENIVNITDLSGTGFQVGATVKLKRAGFSDVSATAVNVVSGSQITCNLPLFGVVGGAWDVEVANPDLQSVTLPAAFTVNVECIKGDVNGDGFVDGADIQRFIDILTGDTGFPAEHCAGDVAPSSNGIIDVSDADAFAQCILSGGC